MADILCGKVNPSGKLSETFPTKIRTDLQYPGNNYVANYPEGIFVGYRYYDAHPEEIEYPFGHGLSYTEFEYSDLEAEQKDSEIHISLQLENIGSCKGAEVVQLYIGDPVSTVERPLKELKGFNKVMLEAGETKKVTFSVSLRDLGYYNVFLKDWITEPGEYIIYVGSSSRDIRVKKSVYVKNDIPYTINNTSEDMIG